MAQIHKRDRTTIVLKAKGLLEPRVPHVANDKYEAYALELKRAYRMHRVYQTIIFLYTIGVLYAIFKH